MSASNKSEPIRTAIIGLGRAGWDIHVRKLKERQDFHIVACVDPQEERQAEAKDSLHCSTHSMLTSFLRNPSGAELAIIASPSHMHTRHCIAALAAGLHVLVEKPMAISSSQATRLLQESRKAHQKGTVFTVNQNYRAHADHRKAMEILTSDLLGRIFFIKMVWNGFARRNDWQTLRKFGGGSLNNNAPHLIDQALQLMQAPVIAVWGDLQTVVTSGDAEDHVKILMRGANGRVIDVEISSACALPQPPLTLYGSRGTMQREGDEYVLRHLDANDLKPLAVDPRLAVPGRKYGVAGEHHLNWIETRQPANPPELRLDFYSELHDSIRHGKRALVSIDEVYQQMRIIDMVRKGVRRETAGRSFGRTKRRFL